MSCRILIFTPSIRTIANCWTLWGHVWVGSRLLNVLWGRIVSFLAWTISIRVFGSWRPTRLWAIATSLLTSWSVPWMITLQCFYVISLIVLLVLACLPSGMNFSSALYIRRGIENVQIITGGWVFLIALWNCTPLVWQLWLIAWRLRSSWGPSRSVALEQGFV